MLPVNGINGNDYRALIFRWASFKLLYTAAYLLLLLINLIILSVRWLEEKDKLAHLGKFW